MIAMLAYYGDRISEHMTETPEGYLICHDVPIARVGEQEYHAREIGLDGDGERIVAVKRYPEDVFAAATLASFEGKDVTDQHPPENISVATHNMYSRGHVENVRRRGDFIVADLHVKDLKLIQDIKNGTMREVSCGYTCYYAPDGNGYKQTEIRGNHVAVVPKGRAGAAVAIKDNAAEKGGEKGGNRKMSKFSEAVLKAFGMAAKDAKPEEMDELTKLAHAALEAEPAEKAPEADPAAEKKEPAKDVDVERAPKGDDLGTKLDKLIEMMGELMKKNDREEKALTDEKDIDDLIEKLTKREAAEELAEEAAENDPQAAVTLPVKKAEELDACGAETPETRDAKIELLKAVRPAVAAIKDKTERAKVADALLNAMRAGAMSDIVKAQHDAAAKANDATARKNFDKMCEEQQNIYNALNAHAKKKEEK